MCGGERGWSRIRGIRYYMSKCVCVCDEAQNLGKQQRKQAQLYHFKIYKNLMQPYQYYVTSDTFAHGSDIKQSLYILPAFQDLYSFSYFYKMPIYFLKSL
jgi:hypothetical protein